MGKTAFIVWAQLTDWCGCESEKYLVYADSEEEACNRALEMDIESEAREFLEDEDIEQEMDGTSIEVVEYNQSEHGDLSWYKEL